MSRAKKDGLMSRNVDAKPDKAQNTVRRREFMAKFGATGGTLESRLGPKNPKLCERYKRKLGP